MMLKTPPLSRAEYQIIRLASRAVGYDPNEDGPWWVWLFQPLAFRAIRGMTRDGILRVTREPSGRALIRATERGEALVDREDLHIGGMPPSRSSL